MIQKIKIFAYCGLLLGSVACQGEDIPAAGESRPIITELTATPGDEEVFLNWKPYPGASPTDYVISYTSGSEIRTRNSGRETSLTLDSLENEVQYTIEVQALYGKLISGVVSTKAKPTTSRFAVRNLEASASDECVTLTWEKPSTQVLSYLLTYYSDADPEAVTTLEIDQDALIFTVDQLVNDINYTFSLVALYPKGRSEAVSVRALPSQAIPYFVDYTHPAIGQEVHLRFNTEGYPSATNVQWSLPDGTQVDGTEISYRFGAAGTQKIGLSARIGTKDKSWDIGFEVREFVVFYSDWVMDGTNYNGFKASCPVFSPDGKTVYNITFNKLTALYAFDVATGTLKWSYVPATKGSSYNMLTVNPISGDIYFGTQTAGQFYAVTPDGQLKWIFTEAGNMQSTAPAVSKDGQTVYIGDRAGNLFALDAASGTARWSRKALGACVSGLLVNGNELIVGLNMTGKNLYFLDAANGNDLAVLSLANKMTDNTGFAVSHDKQVIYIPNTGGKLSSVDIVKRSILVNGFTVATNDLYEPVVAPNGTLFVGSKNSTAYNVAADLSAVLWSHQHISNNNAYNFSHPCVDAQGRFYVSTGQVQNTNYIFSPEGAVLDSWQYGNDAGQKQMGGNNLLNGIFYAGFIGSGDSNGLFVGKYVGGQRGPGWSTHGGDICGSCCIK